MPLQILATEHTIPDAARDRPAISSDCNGTSDG